MVAVLKPEWTIRMMAEPDLDQIMAIERASYPFPWTHGIFTDCLRVGYVCRVVESQGRVTAYSVLTAAAGEAHLLNLCVAPPMRGHGLGGALLEQVLSDARRYEVERLFLEVRPSNAAAQNLYRGRGFRVIGRRPGYYPAPEGREDAVVMVRQLAPDSAC